MSTHMPRAFGPMCAGAHTRTHTRTHTHHVGTAPPPHIEWLVICTTQITMITHLCEWHLVLYRGTAGQLGVAVEGLGSTPTPSPTRQHSMRQEQPLLRETRPSCS